MRVLLTGAAGFLGRHLARRLAGVGCEVIGLSLEPVGLPAGMSFVAADVRDRPAIVGAVDRVAPDAIVHLAALSHVGESWQRLSDYFAVNVLGTENVVAAARGRRLLFASTAEVYGLVPEAEQPIREERPLAPQSPYAMTKAAGERWVRAAGGTVLRLFNLVGPGQAPIFALPSFAAQLAAIEAGRAEPVLAIGNLSARRDFVHVEDGAAAVIRLLERGEPGEVYNLASGRATSIAEALERLIDRAGVQVRLAQDPERLRPVDIPLTCGDSSRLRALGWRPERGLDAALDELWCEARAVEGR